jgi:predicted transcriptional regulator
MHQEIEISSLDLRYEGLRLKKRTQEADLLSSMAECGIEEPLEGVDKEGKHLLLNGFMRVRCARKLGIMKVPYVSIGVDEAAGMVRLLRVPKTEGLTILEQAAFIEELSSQEGLSVAEIAELVSRSKAWVSMRLGLLRDMTAKTRKKLMRGRFSVYAYMHFLRPFMRMNSVSRQDIEEFVKALSGKKLSVREIELLANGFFRGPDSFREQIVAGNVSVSLEQIQQIPADPDGCSDFERGLLKDLDALGRTMQRVMGKINDTRLKSRPFHAEANLLSAGILSRTSAFTQIMRRFYDRSGQA